VLGGSRDVPALCSCRARSRASPWPRVDFRSWQRFPGTWERCPFVEQNCTFSIDLVANWRCCASRGGSMSVTTAPPVAAEKEPRAPAPGGEPPRRRRRCGPNQLRRGISPMALVALWQSASGTGLLPPDKLAAPDVIVRPAWDLAVSGELGEHLVTSLSRVAIGLVIGVTIGLAAALLSGLSGWGNDLVDPPLQMLRTLPHLGLVPLFILWFGIGETPKIALIALGVVFPIYLNVHGAIRGVDPNTSTSRITASSLAHRPLESYSSSLDAMTRRASARLFSFSSNNRSAASRAPALPDSCASCTARTR